jgi:NAD(P)H-hydrate epimerase
VTLASHDEPLEILKDVPEILTARADSEKLWSKRKWTAAAVGPGLGVNDKTEAIIKKLMAIEEAPVVADADAITVIAERKLYPLPKHWILTPHAGELSRLIGVPAKEIEQDRFRYVEEAQKKAGCIVLLKGFRTVIADSGVEKKRSVILSGNSSLAKAGTGDVLTGLIAGLLAQKMTPWKAANCGAFIHGKLADEWLRAGGDRRSLQASDLREMLPTLLQRLARSSRVG